MDETTLVSVLGVVIIIGIIMFLLKSLVKGAIVIAIALVLFKVAFVWQAGDLEKFHLDSFLKPDVAQKIQEGYEGYVDKREETGVMDSEGAQRLIDSTLGKLDKEAILAKVVESLKNFDYQTVEVILEKSKSELEKYGLTADDVKAALDKES